MTSSAESQEYSPLVESLFDAFSSSASGKPTLPRGRRTEVVTLLTRAMNEPQVLTAYTEALASERTRRVLTRKLLALSGPDIPDDAIAAGGFSHLPDDVLADLALSPEALLALEETLFDPERETLPGEWLLPKEIVTSIVNQPATMPDAVVSVTSATRITGGRSGRPWLIAGSAIAASFLIGIVLGPRLLDGTKRPEFALANAVVKSGDGRGVGKLTELQVTNGGEAQAFVTIVGLFPGRTSAVTTNKTASSFLVAAPNRDTVFNNLDPDLNGATVLIVVLSNVPAGEAVRLSLPNEVTTEQAAGIAEQLRRSLPTLNVRAETRVLTFPDKPN